MQQYNTLIKKLSTKVLEILNSLNENQLEKIKFPFEDNERYIWYYTPHPQNGLLIFDMKPYQRKLSYDLLELSYSSNGYKTAKAIINLENILGDYEAAHSDSSEGGSGQWVRSTERYWLAIFGLPNSENKPWGFRIGGHHIGLTVNVLGNDFSMHPLFFGANPAKVIDGPDKGFRALAPEEDQARKLINSLSTEKQAKAIITQNAHSDILTANYRTFDPSNFDQGLKFTEMTDTQRKGLIDLINIYVKRFNLPFANSYQKKIMSIGFENTKFSWAGSTEISQGHYYTIKHDSFLIEYDNVQNDANHIHSVLRDFDSDYGEDILRNHYLSSHS
ncbi:MAG: DUF3500 domain-containing protein [Dehalococcoidia bacterium]|jgi:hypothetical protein|nr:DUF3500 domain-containing protein [Dehalococcoidia bacterium]